MSIVQWVIVAIFIQILGLTIVAAINKEKTVSVTLTEWAWKYNSMAFFAGVLIGHWFFPGAPGITAWPWLLIPLGCLGALDVIAYVYPVPKWIRYPGIWVALGVPSGAFIWAS